MALNPSNSSNLEQLVFKGLKWLIAVTMDGRYSIVSVAISDLE